MYKLVAVGGKIRGKIFQLNEGENIVGRSQYSQIVIDVQGVSKTHFKIDIIGSQAQIEDLGSANGTMLNQKAVRREAIKNGDLISIPDAIFKFVYYEDEKSNGATKKDEISFEAEEQVPSSMLGKVIHLFKYKVMPLIYHLNEVYQWRVLLGILIFFFIASNILFTIGPVLQDTNSLLLREIKLRGAQYADEVARVNAVFLNRGEIDKVDTRFLETTRDISSYLVYDLEGRVIRPIEKLNSIYDEPFAVDARSWILEKEENYSEVYHRILENGEIGIAKAIKAFRVDLQKEVPVGFVSIQFTPASLTIEAANNKRAYLESLLISCFVGVIFFGIIYYYTLRPINELKSQINNYALGKINSLNLKYQMEEIDSLKDLVESILQRNRELSGDGSQDLFEQEDEAPYQRTLTDLTEISSGPTVSLDAQKKFLKINESAEDLIGLRNSMMAGADLIDSVRDQGLSATIIDICDKSSSDSGAPAHGNYEISGRMYRLSSVCLMGRKDKFPKGYLISFLKE
jgi:PAS domain-containing protein